VVRLCSEADLTRLGLAFCPELRRPAQALARGLSAWIEVIPVACTVCQPLLSGNHAAPIDIRRQPPGDPFRQARALNAAQTELNVAFGLCTGAECVLSRAGQAPFTALFVRDVPFAGDPFRAYASSGELRKWLARELSRAAEPQGVK
jgi:uncharacterized metal-binding protein